MFFLWPIKLVVKVLSALVSLVLVYFLFGLGQVWLTSRDYSAHSGQAIMVFGTASYGLTPSPTLARRLDEAVTLYDEKRAPWIVVTGGKRPGDIYTEAQASAQYLEQHGVPRSRILLGSGSDTWQNVESAVPLLAKIHATDVLVVTDPFHEYRAMANCSAQGLTPFATPTQHSWIQPGVAWKFFLKEALDVSVGRIVGYGTLSSWTSGVAAFHPNHGA